MTELRKIAILGLGYVGLPLAVAFGRKQHVIAFDISPQRVAELKEGRDWTTEATAEELAQADLHFTANPDDLTGADLFIVTVPTPVDASRQPDLSALKSASRLLAPHLKAGDIVVYESTVYPGATEEVCLPVLEEASGLRAGKDFSLGYSPERVNPGDKQRKLSQVVKVVAGQDPATTKILAAVYSSVIEAGIHTVANIPTAEAAKVIENTQRDLNIALINELAIIFHRLGLDTREVLAAASTKWNFLPFEAGLVGGHCIGVDPYYLTHKAEVVGYHPHLILAGRRINDDMGRYIVTELIKSMIRDGRPVHGNTATVLGLTFKENVPDLRNTRVVDVVTELRAYGMTVQVHDPLADPEEAQRVLAIELTPTEQLRPAQLIIYAVAHSVYREGGWTMTEKLLEHGQGWVADVKGILDPGAVPAGCHLWRL